MTLLDSGGQSSKEKVTAGLQGQFLWTPYIIELLEQSQWNLQGIDKIRFWRSKVKVTAGHQGGKGISIEVYLLVSSGILPLAVG